MMCPVQIHSLLRHVKIQIRRHESFCEHWRNSVSGKRVYQKWRGWETALEAVIGQDATPPADPPVTEPPPAAAEWRGTDD